MRVVLATLSIGAVLRHCEPGDPGDTGDTGVVVCQPEECGPAPGMPNTLCSDGQTWAGPGDCVLTADGSCGWEIVECPTVVACDPSGCGPALGMPNTLCPDGVTVAGPGDCVASPDGSCGWEIVECSETP